MDICIYFLMSKVKYTVFFLYPRISCLILSLQYMLQKELFDIDFLRKEELVVYGVVLHMA